MRGMNSYVKNSPFFPAMRVGTAVTLKVRGLKFQSGGVRRHAGSVGDCSQEAKALLSHNLKASCKQITNFMQI